MVAATERDRRGVRRAGRATAVLLADLARRAEPGITTRELDAVAAGAMRRLGAEPVFRTQNGFPGCINTSVNDEAVHGVPGDRVLRTGDLLKIDCGLQLGGYCGDATVTVGVGPAAELPEGSRAVLVTARSALGRGIAAARAGGRVGDIGAAMERYVAGQGFALLREYTGHGLGRRLWEPPTVPSVGRAGSGARLVEGLVLTIEPIVVGGAAATVVGPDGWTVRTTDGEPAAQFEATIMVGTNGAEVLTDAGDGATTPVPAASA